jgi:uncharacterized membrane protein SpoIIM required for sporulation
LSEALLKSVRFRRERENAWRRLERYVDRLESTGPTGLTPRELVEVPMLYRSALTSLSVARAISLDRNVVEYLDVLCARAFCCVHAPRRAAGQAIVEFVVRTFPRAVRSILPHLAVASFVLLAGLAAAWLLVSQDPERFHAFVPDEIAGGRGPGASTADLRDPLYGTGSAEELGFFSAYLFQHNATIGIVCFALGFAAGLPVFFFMLTTGMMLGAFAALYQSRGLGAELWAWLLPHGVPEIGAILLCGAAGLRVAEGLLLPGPHPRLATLAAAGRQAGVVALGAVGMFFVAGLLEGFFRQMVHDVPTRYGVALAGAFCWIAYFQWSGREEAP